jgi:SAM-dependent methyltransferase
MEEDRGVLARVVPGYREARIVMTACRLGVFDALAGRGMTAAELSGCLGLEEARSVLFFDALTALGLLEKEGALYRLTPLSHKHLLSGGPEYMGEVFKHQDRMWGPWSRLEKRLRGEGSTSSILNRLRNFMGKWEKKGRREYMLAMESNAERLGPGVIDDVNLDGVESLLDLGGGPGAYSRLFLGKKPGLRVTLFDLPAMIAIAEGLEKNLALRGGISYRSGNFLEDDLGRDYDMVWASNIIHTLDHRGVSLLLARCHQSLKPGGRILIHDYFLDESGTSPRNAAVFSIHMMMVSNRGRCYRTDEIRASLVKAGFEDIIQPDLTGDSAVFRGTKGI